MLSWTKPLFLLLISALWAGAAHAAACCGGGFAAPAVIVGDDKAQLTASISYTQVEDDVGADSLWRPRESKETTDTYKIEGAHIFADSWQAGFSLPLVKRALGSDQAAGLGDVSGTLGYEFLPDWDYNPWRPRGLGYLQVTFPTGRSVNEAEDIYQLDSRGRGFWALGAGTILSKILGRWDLYNTLDGHRSFNKQYSNSQSQGTLKPRYGGNIGLGGGLNFWDLRLGAGITWSYEDPVAVFGTVISQGIAQRFATATASASYLFAENWTASLTYADQTLFGNPLNASLGRGATLLLQKRWFR